MTKYDIRLYTDKGVRIHDKGVNDREKGAKYDLEGIPGKLACVVIDYLKNSPYPGAMKARVMAGRRRTEYLLLLENNYLDAYCHVFRSKEVEVQEDQAAHRVFGVPEQGRREQVTGYTVRLYTDKGVRIHSSQIVCSGRDIPDLLAGITEDYLKNAPYPGNIHALVGAGSDPAIYLIRVENDALDVYCYAERFTRADVQDPPECFHRTRQNDGGPFLMHADWKIAGPTP